MFCTKLILVVAQIPAVGTLRLLAVAAAVGRLAERAVKPPAAAGQPAAAEFPAVAGVTAEVVATLAATADGRGRLTSW